MINIYTRNIIIFVIAVLLQVFVLENINLGGYLNPYFYVVFILLLPFETPGWGLLTSAFLIGFIIDAFLNTFGMHTAATVFMAFLRPLTLKALSPKDGYDKGTLPGIFYFGFPWFLKYALILVFMHHLMLFYIEVFRFSGFLLTFLRVIMSTILTLGIIVVSQFH